jgi:hypothetical protein
MFFYRNSKNIILNMKFQNYEDVVATGHDLGAIVCNGNDKGLLVGIGNEKAVSMALAMTRGRQLGPHTPPTSNYCCRYQR